MIRAFITIRHCAIYGAAAGMLATGAPALAGGPVAKPCPPTPETAACLSTIGPSSDDLGPRFEVRDIKLYPRSAGAGKLIVTFAACVVANVSAVSNVTAHAMLIDRQGRMISLTNGQPECDPNPPTGLPKSAPPLLIFATGESAAISNAEWQNKSQQVVIVVSWTDGSNVRHKDAFYVPYSTGPDLAAKKI